MLTNFENFRFRVPVLLAAFTVVTSCTGVDSSTRATIAANERAQTELLDGHYKNAVEVAFGPVFDICLNFALTGNLDDQALFKLGYGKENVAGQEQLTKKPDESHPGNRAMRFDAPERRCSMSTTATIPKVAYLDAFSRERMEEKKFEFVSGTVNEQWQGNKLPHGDLLYRGQGQEIMIKTLSGGTGSVSVAIIDIFPKPSN